MKPNRHMIRLLVAASLAASSGPMRVVTAATAADTVTNPLEKLEKLEEQIQRDKQQAGILKESAAQYWRDQDVLRARLIQAAALSQSRERELNAVEQRLALLETREATAVHALESQRTKLAALLAVLQRMGREPPPALVVRPLDATGAARSAMLLSAVVPAVQNTAKQLGKGLSGLKALRQKAATERLQVAAAAGALEKDRNTLGQLLTQRRQLADRAVQDLATTNNRIKKLATEAVDLRSLISSLEEDGRRPEIRGAAPIVTNQIASAGAARSPALDDLRGRLSLPANGRLAATFGSSDGLGGRLAGIYLETLPGSAVTSPCDGKIMFAGPFRGYGPMLIISANGGYHVLLAGLTNIDGVVGQVVLAGEPLGRMGTGRPVQQGGVQRDPGMASGKRLYIEFRRNSVPVDPVPWFAALRERVSG